MCVAAILLVLSVAPILPILSGNVAWLFLSVAAIQLFCEGLLSDDLLDLDHAECIVETGTDFTTPRTWAALYPALI